MNYFIAFALLIVWLCWYLTRKSPMRITLSSKHLEAEKLIAAYRQRIHDNPNAQSEYEARLYYELKQLGSDDAPMMTRLPYWALPLVIVGALLGLWYWYAGLGGKYILERQTLEQRWQVLITQNLQTDVAQYPPIAAANHVLCQSMQRQLKREDVYQLRNLARCYEQYGNYQVAASIYRYAMRLAETDEEFALSYARTALFAHQAQKTMPDEVKETLKRLRRDNPENIMAGILLASGYLQQGAREQSLALWRELAEQTPNTHPLYPTIIETLNRLQTTSSDNP